MVQALGISLVGNIILFILFCLAWEQSFEYKQSKKRLRATIKESLLWRGKLL